MTFIRALFAAILVAAVPLVASADGEVQLPRSTQPDTDVVIPGGAVLQVPRRAILPNGEVQYPSGSKYGWTRGEVDALRAELERLDQQINDLHARVTQL